MVRRLILWDVDGTLVRAGDIGAAVFDSAIESVLGAAPPERVRMSGKTDPQIVLEYLELMGVDPSPGVVEAILEALEGHLAAAGAAGVLVAGGYACHGVADILQTLAGDDRVVSSLLTGNIHPNALVKVAAFGLDQWLDLDVGAYGSDHADREQLVPIALARLENERGQQLTGGDVWVVGDTPRDLACARAAGSRCALVATGRYTVGELADLGADAVFEDLSDHDSVVKLLTGDL